MPQTHVLNPQTNRMLKLTSKNCKRLIQLGIIQPPEPQENTKDSDETKLVSSQLTQEPEPPKPPEVPVREANRTSIEKELKKEVKTEMKKIINENKNEFKELSQRETDALLKRMLFEKLCVNKPKPKKIAKPKTKKYKVVQPSSSDESSSEESE